ncbi:MAG: Stage II sporulation protein E [Eubacteriales bacterium SKADARSKE-1]|nr:Stage II sporulation protein E [Eubacteriales bacterium SKADARSKE-1]
MKTSELVTNEKVRLKLFLSDQGKSVILNVLYFILGIFVSKGTIMGEYAPFGVALVASVPYENIWVSLLGTIIGYIIPSEMNVGIRYIATVIAVCAVRWTFNDLKKIKEHPLFAPLLAALPILATGFAINKFNGLWGNRISINFIEAILAGGFAYFFKETSFIMSGKKSSLTISQRELASIILSICVVILSLSGVMLGPVSIGRILAIVAILFCSQHLGITGGSVSGIAAGVIFGLAFKEPSYVVGAYSLGGLIAGMVSRFGKFALAGAFMIANLMLSVQIEKSETIISCVYEVVLAAIIFIFLPDRLGNKFMGLFYYPKNCEDSKSLQKSVLMRLDFTANALINVSDSINAVSKKLSRLSNFSLEKIYSYIMENVCTHCGLRTLCWETRRDETINSFDLAAKTLSENKEIKIENFPKAIATRCCRLNEISEFTNRFYRENSIRNASKQKINEVKSFISEQFSDMGGILEDISKEFKYYDSFDLKMEQNVTGVLKSLGLIPLDVSCRIDRFRRISLEIEILHKEKETLELLNLNEILSKECFKTLDKPCITMMPDRCKIYISEKPVFNLQIGSAQHICNNESLCGDSYTYFNDGKGRVIFVLSDGMGTGGRAAVEGAMACEIISSLIKAKIGFETALKITNSALFAKSEDESLSTLDIICFDLFTGKVEFIKAGAPVTFIKKNEKVEQIDLPSLPVGILKNINFVYKKAELSKNDRILMLSDGAIYPDDIWINEEFERWTDETPQVFAERIIKRAVSLRNQGHDDDITIITMKVE